MTKRYEDVLLSEINTDGFTQTRQSIDYDVVRQYQDAYESGETLPAVTLFDDGQTMWVGDGFHRIEALVCLGREAVAAEIHEGGRVDALRFALGANAHHGLRRSQGDLQYAVLMAWESRDELGLGKNPSARMIAELVKVSPTTALKYLTGAPGYDAEGKRTGADGKEYPGKDVPKVASGPAVVEMDLERDAEESAVREGHGFRWNEHGACINPQEQNLEMPRGTRALLYLAQTPSGMWVFGYDLNVALGDGVGCAALLGSKKYETADDAAEAFLDLSQTWFAKIKGEVSASAARELMAARVVREAGCVKIEMGEPAKPAKRKKVDVYTVVAKVACTLRVVADSEEAAKAAIEADNFRLLLENGQMSNAEVWTWEKVKGYADDADTMDLRKGGAL